MKKEKRVSTKKLVVEFFAIVFGVLMALALDAWYEQYQKKQLSREYISRLTDELFEARQLLERMDRLITRCIDAGTEVSGFFETKKPYKDESRLIVSLYNMGRDMPDRFITSTYDDLIATGNLGLIEQVSQRDAILQAYSSLRNYEQYLAPYRDEYLAGVRGWIPQKVISQIRERCPSGMQEVDWNCPDVVLDPEDVSSIIPHLLTDDALLAYRLREQGLFVNQWYLVRAAEAVERALAMLNGRSI